MAHTIQINATQQQLLTRALLVALENPAFCAQLALETYETVEGLAGENALQEVQVLRSMFAELEFYNGPADTVHGFCL